MKRLIIGLLILFNVHSAWAGASRNFDGISDSIDFTKPAGLVVGTDSFVRMGWFYWTNGADTVEEVIFSQQDGTGTGRNWIWIDANQSSCGALDEFHSFLGGVDTCGSDLAENVWYHGTVVSDEGAGTVILYLNSVQDASATRTVEAATGILRTGVQKTLTTQDFEGQMAHNILCEGTLTTGQILEISINPEIASRAFCGTNLYMYNPFWGLESPEVDISSNGATGTLTETAESFNGPPIMLNGLPL